MPEETCIKRWKEERRMLSEEMIRDLVNGLQLIFAKNVTQIILYGSVARQEESVESDIDIAVIKQLKVDGRRGSMD